MRRRRKQRARGCVFEHGRSWWVQYRTNGERVRVNTHIPLTEPEGRELAETFLKKRLERVDQSPMIPGRLTFEQLSELVRQDYVRRGRRSLDRAERSLAQLSKRFAGKRVDEIAAGLDGYVDARLTVVSSGTVRLELAALKRAFALAVEKRPPILSPADVPSFPSLKAGDPREGFFEREDFEKVASHLPQHVVGIAWLAYFTGMRRGEILSLTWANVDRAAKVIRLNKTKNGKRRLLAYGKSPELVAVIERQHEARMALGRESAALTPWLFHRAGEPVRDFRGAWSNACKSAGVPGALFHDLRRTAIRNMVRSGVADVVAMSISGHRTRSVFDRYNIVNEADIAEALGRVHLGHSLSHKSESASDDDAASR